MDRRGFIQTTFSGGLAVGAVGCASTQAQPQTAAPLSEDEMARKLRKIDRVVDRMDRVPDDWFLAHRSRAGGVADAPATEAEGETVAMEGELLRASMRSLFVTSSLAELPREQQTEPEVVERLRRVSGEADFAVFGTLAKLDSLDDDRLAEIDTLAREPDFVDRVLEDIDVLSRDLEVPASRRRHLRRMAKHLSWRLERQPMSAVIREVVDTIGAQVEVWSRRLVQEGGMTPAFADGDPRWIERSEAVVRMYAPAGWSAPTDEPAPDPADEPTPDLVDVPAGAEAPADASPDPAATQPEPAPAGALPSADATSYPAGQPIEHEFARTPDYQAQELAKAKQRIKQGQIMFGVGLGLGLLGAGGVIAALYSPVFGLLIPSSVALTAAGILLIIGAVFWGLGARAAKRLQEG